PDKQVFCATVSSSDGKSVYSSLFGDKLSFVVSDRLGRVLDASYQANKKYLTNLYCKVGRIDETPVARIEKIEFFYNSGEINEVVEDGQEVKRVDARVEAKREAFVAFVKDHIGQRNARSDQRIDAAVSELSSSELSVICRAFLEWMAVDPRGDS